MNESVLSQIAMPQENRLLRENQNIERLKEIITIQEVLNGYVVQVGCKTVVFESMEKLLSELKRYLLDRNGVEKEYLKQK